MEVKPDQSVTEPTSSGATAENGANLAKAENDYKRDMLRYKDEAAELREQLKEIQLEKETKSGNLEGVISTLKEEIKELKNNNAQDRYAFANTHIDNAIQAEAMGRGLKGEKLGAFMELVKHSEDKKLVEVFKADNKFSVKQDDVKNVVDKQLDRYKGLFKTSVNVVDSTPNNTPVNEPQKPAFNMQTATSKEIQEYILANKDKLK